jgi:hypothetical protein
VNEEDSTNNLANQADAEPSLLERVISSQQTATMEQFHPNEVVAALFRGLSEKEEDVLRRRFGLSTDEIETLEDIGRRYGVTRERIRQIQAGAIGKIKRAKGFPQSRGPFEQLVVSVLTESGGIVEEEQLFHDLLSFAGDTPTHRQALRFLLTELLDDRVRFLPVSANFRAGWGLSHASEEPGRALVRDATDFFSNRGQPATREELLAAARSFPTVANTPDRYLPNVVLAILARSKAVAFNPYGDWGLAAWGSIVPKRINDKIALVLEKAGAPLHFTEIAKRINDAHFDSRTAYAPTVHNELILNSQYVLVGRGLYALKSWGYREGVVADVIEDVLHKSGRPMTRAEIVGEVLKQRFVKKNTIHLALTNRARFEKHGDGRFSLSGGSHA